MKGIVRVGGLGARMFTLTKITNKHLFHRNAGAGLRIIEIAIFE